MSDDTRLVERERRDIAKLRTAARTDPTHARLFDATATAWESSLERCGEIEAQRWSPVVRQVLDLAGGER